MLVIVGGTGVAAAEPCDPCPPDCPMMAQLTAETHATDPGKGQQQADSPCKQMIVCQPGPFAVPPDPTSSKAVLSYEAAALCWTSALAVRSRPPDRQIRPPIAS